MSSGGAQTVEVLVLTAADGEPEAVRAVEEGAVTPWTMRHLADPSWTYEQRTYRRADGRTFEVALVHAHQMGETTAAALATRFIAELKPSVLAMCGVCAGRPGRTELGDVVIAEMLFKYDAGEVVRKKSGGPVQYKADGRRRDLPRHWLTRAQSFAKSFPAKPEAAALVNARPWPTAHAELWVLDMLERGEDPAFGRAIHLEPSAWTAVYDALSAATQVTMNAGRLELLPAGRDRLASERMRRAGELAPRPWKVVVAPFGTGSALVRDVDIWDHISDQARHVHALDMEGAAVGEVGWIENIDPTLVVKGVMDFAEPDRPGHVRAFAARAAAETLFSFLRDHIELEGTAVDDVLETGIAERPPGVTNPGSLLHPRYREIAFVTEVRTRELADLRAWCARPALLGARLFHGPGGTGKTRLFLEWADILRQEDWTAGFLPPTLDESDVRRLLKNPKPTLLIIDYAEARTDLLDVMRRVATRRGDGRLRVVLLTREVADWWKRLRASDPAVDGLLGMDEPTLVHPVPLDGSARTDVFHAAVRRFADLLGRPLAAAPAPAPDLSGPEFGRLLYLAMAALAFVDGQPLCAGDAGLLNVTIAHERRYWLRRFEQELPAALEARGRFEDQMSRLVAAVTLRGGMPRGPEASELQHRVNGPASPEVLDWLASVYPHRTGSRHDRVTTIAPLEPDLLGEQLVLEVLHHHDTPSSFLDAVLANSDENAKASAFRVLGRLGARSGDQCDVDVWIERLVGDDPESAAGPALMAMLALRTTTAHAPIGAILARKLTEVGGSSALATRIDELLPQSEPSVSLRELRAWAAQRQLDELRVVRDPSPRVEAHLLQNLGATLSALGRREAALAATEGAVTLYRRLAEARPDAFVPDLAKSLTNLGGTLSALGRLEDALAATEEAVTVYRHVAKAWPEVFAPNLASSLTNLGNRLNALGRLEDALAATEEAVAIRRDLARARPDAFAPGLAISLTNLGTTLSDLGRREEALAVTEEAVTLYRDLAKARPDAFAPDLASSLNNLGNMLSDLGRREEALAAAEEAVAIRRDLARARPDAFAPDLASSLTNLGNRLSDLGRRDEALVASEEAVTLYRDLAKARPDAFAPDLAISLNNLGNRLNVLGRREEALAASEEAVTLYRHVARARPDAFAPDLASSLNNLGNRLNALGRLEDALAATEEAVAIRRDLAKARPEVFVHDLAGSMNNLGNMLNVLGRREEALAATEEAVTLYRHVAKARPDAFAPDLARSMNNLGDMLSNLGRREEALAATEEAVTLYRDLTRSQPNAFVPHLADSLTNLGIVLSELGRRDAALAATEEAVAIRRDLAKARPEVFVHDLATSLNNLGIVLGELGRREEALGATEEAVTLYRHVAKARPNAFAPDLARSLNNLGDMLSDLGRREEALAATEEAVTLYRDLTKSQPNSFVPDLARSLNNLGIVLSELGRRDAALGATEEAVTIYRGLAKARPDAFAPDLAKSLANLGNRLSVLGRQDAALGATDEAVTLFRNLAKARLDAFAPDLAKSLTNLGNKLRDLGRREAALAATEEAVTLFRDLARARPEAFAPDLAKSLTNLGNKLSALGRREAALAATEEAVTLYRDLAKVWPDAFATSLAASLNDLATVLSELGRREAALAASEEAGALYQ